MGRLACQGALAITFATLVGVTVWFGATSPASLAAAELAIYGAALLLALSGRNILDARYRTPLDLPLLSILILPLLQLVPLPSPLVQLVSPGLNRLRVSLTGPPPGLIPLSAYPYATTQAVNRLAAAVLVFFIITRAVTSSRLLRLALLTLVWLGVAEAAYGLLGYLLDSPTILGVRPQAYPGSATGTLVCKNHFAGLMELLLPVSLAYYWSTSPQSGRRPIPEQRGRQVIILLATMLMTLALLFSRSRAGVVSLVAALGITAVLARRDRQRHFGGVTFLVLAAAILIYGNVIGLDPVISRFHDLSKETALSRVEIWKDGLKLARLSPIVGSGAGTWPALFPAVKSSPVQLTFSHAHNDYVETLAEGGVAGLCLLLWCLVAVWLQVRKSLAQREAPALCRLVIASLFAGILSLAIHGLADFNLQIPSNLFLFFALLGLLSVVTRDPPVALISATGSTPVHDARRPRYRSSPAMSGNRGTPACGRLQSRLNRQASQGLSR